MRLLLRYVLRYLAVYVLYFIVSSAAQVRSQSLGFLELLSPQQHEVISAGSIFDITWGTLSNYGGTVTIALLRVATENIIPSIQTLTGESTI